MMISLGRPTATSLIYLFLCTVLTGQELVEVNIEFQGLDNGSASELIGSYLYTPMKRREFGEYAAGRVLRRAAEVAGVCELTEAAKIRLEQAAQADVDRMRGRIRRLELDYRGVPLDNSPKSREGIAAIQRFKQELESDQPLDNSLLDRMLPKILTAEQRRKLAEHEEAKVTRRIEAACRVLIARLERSMPLIGDQRDRLLEAMLVVPQPRGFPPEQELRLAYRAFCSLSDTELAEILDSPQLKVVKQYRARWGGLAAAVN